jgi:glycosyltransferase involved in cell wall biosynthesis
MAKVSVIIPAWNSHETIGACLESLSRQTFRDFEVIVVDSSQNSETAEVVKRFPEVRLERSPMRLLPHPARNLGVRLAQGSILVFSDPDCVMLPDWLQHLVAAADAGHALVGGSIGSVSTGWFSGGVHLCKFAWWLPGGPRANRPEFATANVSYSRGTFERFGPFPEVWCGDSMLSRRVVASGIQPLFEPHAKVLHDHRTGWRGFLRERFARGYDYGRVRPQTKNWPRSRLLAYALGWPVICCVMLFRAARYAHESGQLGSFAWCFPVIASGNAVWAWGESRAHWNSAWRRS